MKLKFLGIGSAFNTKYGNTSAYLKEGHQMFLIDCGCTVFSKIIEKGLLDDVEDLYIAITHSHPDHIGSLGDLIFYCYYVKRIRVHLIHRKKYVNVYYDYLSVMNVKNFMYDYIDKRFFIGENIVELSPIEVRHDEGQNSYGFEITVGNDAIFYSGDTNSENVVICFMENPQSILYHECSYYEKGLGVHTSFETLKKIPLELRNRVWLMHIDCEQAIQEARALGFNIAQID